MGRGIMPMDDPRGMAEWLEGVEEGVSVGPDVLRPVSAMLRRMERLILAKPRTAAEMPLDEYRALTNQMREKPDHEIVAEIAGRISAADTDQRFTIAQHVSDARAILAEARRQCAGEAQAERLEPVWVHGDWDEDRLGEAAMRAHSEGRQCELLLNVDTGERKIVPPQEIWDLATGGGDQCAGEAQEGGAQ